MTSSATNGATRIFPKIETQQIANESPPKQRQGDFAWCEAAELSFFWRDGESKDFTLQLKDEFGTKDLKNVRLLASTGSRGSLARHSDRRRVDSGRRVCENDRNPICAGRTAARAKMAADSRCRHATLSLGICFCGATPPSHTRKEVGGKGCEHDASHLIVFDCASCGTRSKSKRNWPAARLSVPSVAKPPTCPMRSPARRICHDDHHLMQSPRHDGGRLCLFAKGGTARLATFGRAGDCGGVGLWRQVRTVR